MIAITAYRITALISFDGRPSGTVLTLAPLIISLSLICENNFKSFFFGGIAERIIRLHDLIEREVMSDKLLRLELPGLNSFQQHGG